MGKVDGKVDVGGCGGWDWERGGGEGGCGGVEGGL